MLILIPSVLVFCCIRARDKAVVPVIITGAVTGVLVCSMAALFSFRHRIPEYSFGSNFMYYAGIEYIIPLVLLYIAYFFITKDSLEFRIRACFPVLASFFSVYMPYYIISSAEAAFSFFELFVKPVLVLSMLIICANFVFMIGKAACEKKMRFVAVLSVLFALALFIPPFINTLWLLKMLLPVVYAGSVAYAFLSLVLFVISVRNSDGILL